MNNLENEKEIAQSIRKAAILKNWKLFKQSRLGMVGLYIVSFFFICNFFYFFKKKFFLL